MKQHAVPENIMDVEFKLFGSLTAKQFGYIIAGGGIALFFYYFFKSLNTTFLGWIFVVLSVILGLSLALIRINEQPFEVWLGNFLSAMFSSQKRVWKKSKKVPKVLEKKQLSQTVPIQSVTRSVPQQVQAPVDPIRMNTQKTQQVPTQPVSQAKQQSDTPSIPQHPFKDLSKKQEKDKEEQDTIIDTTAADEVKTPIAGKGVKENGFYVPGSAQGFVKTSTNQIPNRPVSVPPSLSTQQPVSSKPVVQDNQANLGVNTSLKPQDEQKPSSSVAGGAIDSSSKLQNMQDTDSPIKDEVIADKDNKVVAPSTQNVIDEQQKSAKSPHSNKAQIYSDIVPDMKELSQEPAIQSAQGDNVSKEPDEDFKEENKALRQKVVSYSEEKTQLEQELSRSQEMQKKLKEQNEKIATQLEKLKHGAPAPPIESASQSPGPQLPTLPTQPVGKISEESDLEVLSPKVYNGPSLSKKPNVISGIVKTTDGKLLPGVVVIVKSEQGRPVRAIKTNSLGQFVTTTALENGTYTIELSRNEYSFGIYEIKLTGDVLPTYEFIAE
jgi:hypothetical protein